MKIFTDEFEAKFIEVSGNILGATIVFGPILFLIWLAFAIESGKFGF